MRAWASWVSATALAAILAGCASVYNLPGSVPLGAALADNNVGGDVPSYDDDVLLALSFSGGGTRAAAFSFGVLTELDRSRADSNHAKSLLDRVDFVSGVSGGSVTARPLEGPSGVELVSAAADTAIDASVRSSYAAFSALASDWSGKMKRWRCGLSAAERTRLGAGKNWRCDDVSFFIDRVSFDQLGPARAGILNAIPTRFNLPAEQVDLLIENGADALRQSSRIRRFAAAFDHRNAHFSGLTDAISCAKPKSS